VLEPQGLGGIRRETASALGASPSAAGASYPRIGSSSGGRRGCRSLGEPPTAHHCPYGSRVLAPLRAGTSAARRLSPRKSRRPAVGLVETPESELSIHRPPAVDSRRRGRLQPRSGAGEGKRVELTPIVARAVGSIALFPSRVVRSVADRLSWAKSRSGQHGRPRPPCRSIPRSPHPSVRPGCGGVAMGGRGARSAEGMLPAVPGERKRSGLRERAVWDRIAESRDAAQRSSIPSRALVGR